MSVPRRSLLLLAVALLVSCLVCTDTTSTLTASASAIKEGTGTDTAKKPDVARRPAKAPAKARPKKPEPADEDADVNDLHLEVVALQVLADLQVTPAQLKALATLAESTAQKPGPRVVVKVTGKYRKTLTDLRNALAAQDEDRTEELSTALDKLREKETPEFDDVEITDAARKQAPAVLRRLSARQVVAYLAGASSFPDPGEKLLDGLAQSRELNGKSWRDFRDGVADDVGWLVAGLDSKTEQKVRERALALLNKTHRLTEKEYTDQKLALDKEANEITSKAEPIQVMRHYMERSLAELLANPRLAAAIAARQKKKS